jgi:hypothetical protein
VLSAPEQQPQLPPQQQRLVLPHLQHKPQLCQPSSSSRNSSSSSSSSSCSGQVTLSGSHYQVSTAPLLWANVLLLVIRTPGTSAALLQQQELQLWPRRLLVGGGPAAAAVEQQGLQLGRIF